MPGPALLVYFNRLTKLARETGKNRSLIELVIQYLGGDKIDPQYSIILSKRLIAADDRYLANMAPVVTESNIVDAFSYVRSNLPDHGDYPVSNDRAVRNLKEFLSPFTPDLLQRQCSIYSPVEALLLLFLIVYNDGGIRLGDEAMNAGSTESTTRRMIQSIQDQVSAMSSPQLEAWIDAILTKLHL